MNIILWNRYQVAQIICALEANRRKWSMHRAALSGDQAVVKNGCADINLMPADVSRTHTLRYRKRRREEKSERERAKQGSMKEMEAATHTWGSSSSHLAVCFAFSCHYF